MREIRRREISAEGKAEAGVLVPVADVRCGDPIGAAEQTQETAEPAFDIVNGRAAFCSFGKGERLRAVSFTGRR